MRGGTRRGRERIVSRLIALAWFAGAGSALAAEGDCYDYGSLGAGSGPSLGTIKPGEARVPFVQGASGRKGCPGADPACREKAFLVPGNTVILGGTVPGFVCATYVGQKGAVRAGWLPENAVAREPTPPAPAPKDWTGTWTAPEQTIRIRPGKTAGTLAVEGDATYGTLDPDRVRRGAVNMGSVAGEAAPSGHTLAFTMGDKGTLPFTAGAPTDCRLRLQLLSPFLLAEDNSACGGLNVTFANVYRRTKP
ncbi:hypothetical protein SAMN02799631_00183 [Methylobacterium sp. 174MFSha1.1]|uniref:hypothetical protein n=1 Tax=Methylobacterium sp. 174MFSha1.1 TaxID=1502749 RepID=UPI0008E61D2E|nr:hypothetical protein [Methylobacterium sp. 174MFSha1.1]SFU33273.1 hypothetical protein SAMN02799631_00183 [Methylobacterium sp. 174MFSha1.1]